MKNKLYRQNVAAIIVDEDYPKSHNIFSGRRNDIKNVWQFPQGGIDEGETPIQALYRELNEEIGSNKEDIEIIATCPIWFQYSFPNFKWGNYIGQQQKYFLVKINQQNINIQTAHPEFTDFKFDSINNTIQNVSVLKKPIYSKVIEYFEKKGYL